MTFVQQTIQKLQVGCDTYSVAENTVRVKRGTRIGKLVNPDDYCGCVRAYVTIGQNYVCVVTV